jgi:RNA polymerase sigma-70 factor (ECF subfamily)
MMTDPKNSDAADRAIDAGAAFVRYRGRVCRWACAMGCTHEQSLDAVQEVFLRLVRTESRPTSERALPAWLRQTTARVVVDVWRAGTSREERERAAMSSRLTGTAPLDPASEHDASDAARIVRQSLRELSEQQRLVLVCKTVDGLTFAQISQELGIGVPTAKTHYLRALEAIRGRLAEHGVTEVPNAV